MYVGLSSPLAARRIKKCRISSLLLTYDISHLFFLLLSIIDMYDANKVYLPEVALKAALLGSVFTGSLVALCTSNYPVLAIYAASISVFHMSEFLTTAIYNSSEVDSDSFVLNDVELLAVYAVAVAEYAIHSTFLPETMSVAHILGFSLMCMGQAFRTTAMCTAGESFNHYIQREHKEKHKLVTSGIYSILRHPLYFGFFWLIVGQQLFLGNYYFLLYICAYKLWVFFKNRIEFEESFLIEFFGDDYIIYKSKTKVLIPFLN